MDKGNDFLIRDSSVLLQGGAAKNLFESGLEPSVYDAMFPIFAFIMVIVIPSLVAIWVIYKTLTEKECAENER